MRRRSGLRRVERYLALDCSEHYFPPRICRLDAAEIALLESQVWEGREIVVLLWRPQDAIRNIMIIVVDMTALHLMNVYQLCLVSCSGWRNILPGVGMSFDMTGLDGAGDLGGE